MLDTQIEQRLEERQLIQSARMGEQKAFQQLVEIYQALVWRTICILVQDRAIAEDILQEAWIDVWRGLLGFQSDRPFRPWLLTIVTNRCRKSARRIVPFNQPLESLTEDGHPVATDDLLGQLVRSEMRQELKNILKTLPKDQQHALELRYFAELDYSEIAMIMGVSVGTCARNALRVRCLPPPVVPRRHPLALTKWYWPQGIVPTRRFSITCCVNVQG
jgi:RNA polymerase sigma-70 factor (ECF subfamily)